MPAPPSTNAPDPEFKVHFDWTEWLPFITDPDLSDTQKQEMIETLWVIVLTFVDLGCEVRSAPEETSGQIPDLRAALTAAVVYSEETEEAL